MEIITRLTHKHNDMFSILDSLNLGKYFLSTNTKNTVIYLRIIDSIETYKGTCIFNCFE